MLWLWRRVPEEKIEGRKWREVVSVYEHRNMNIILYTNHSVER